MDRVAGGIACCYVVVRAQETRVCLDSRMIRVTSMIVVLEVTISVVIAVNGARGRGCTMGGMALIAWVSHETRVEATLIAVARVIWTCQFGALWVYTRVITTSLFRALGVVTLIVGIALILPGTWYGTWRGARSVLEIATVVAKFLERDLGKVEFRIGMLLVVDLRDFGG